MPTPRAAAIYARISNDPEGTRLGVQRQVKDCHRLAKQLGWPVAGEYVDNDLSAYSGRKRPEYERMLTNIRDGLVDAVLVYHIDRLTRRPIELEQFLAVVDAAGVTKVRFVAGDTDLATGDGLLMARIMGAVAANESASKSRRVKRQAEEAARAGMPRKGSRRPFGYADDGITVLPAEAEIVRALAARYLAGESLISLTRWLGDNGVKSVYGKPWRTTTLRTMLCNPRYAGLRTYHGEVVAKAVWEPIISEADHHKLVAKVASKAVSGKRPPQRYLLSGLLRCGKCENRLFSSVRGNVRRYVCLSSPDHGGCGRLTVVADPVERLIADAVLYRLDTPELADVLAGRVAADAKAAAANQDLAVLRERLDELARAYSDQQFTMREWMTARKPLEAKVADAERKVARLTRSDALADAVGNGDQLRRDWGKLNLSRQRAIVEAVFDHAVIAPGKSGARTLDPDRVQPVWRL